MSEPRKPTLLWQQGVYFLCLHLSIKAECFILCRRNDKNNTCHRVNDREASLKISFHRKPSKVIK